MLRISKLTDYAMLLLSAMAKAPNDVRSATTLSSLLSIPAPTVSKVLKMLAEAHLVISQRGAEGGYLLARPAAAISVADVISAMEGGVALTECCEKTTLCALESTCTLRENWRTINNLVYSLLAKLTILDMGQPISTMGLSNGK